jgi:L-fuconolactonase
MIRVDSHQHFWRYDPQQYGWMTEQMSVLRRDRLPEDLQPLLKSIGFDGCIAVQARQTVEETEWLLKLADQHEFIKGVVGWVDLRSPKLREQLERYAPHPKLVGVRHVVQDEPDDNFMLRPEFRAGIAQLGDLGLTYDLLIFPKHLPVAVKLAQEFPQQPFVLDHIAKPSIQSRQLGAWKGDMKALAKCGNVYCKLSGMVTEAVWNQWRNEDFLPYLEVAVEAFGTSRLMIGSDWPVCTLSGDYERTMRVVIDYLAQFPSRDREDVLGGNCARFYGINPDPSKA